MKRRGDEDVYFSRKDKENLKKLVKKLEAVSDEPEESPEADQQRRRKLLSLVSAHNVRLPERVLDDLIRWKKGEI